MAIFISLAAGAINVNSLNRGSTISIGETQQPGWSINGKNNFGNGQMFGANLEAGFVSNLLDNDIVDSPMAGVSPVPSVQNQVL